MDATRKSRRARALGLLTAVLSALLLIGGGVGLSTAASADTMPPDPTNPATPMPANKTLMTGPFLLLGAVKSNV